ncbi:MULTISPECIES: SRPBCC domain-containing protein [Sphingomonadales]|uniref:Polyketide cyclase / dehydrase and lipid transport n=1 Tax=Edaphosphingomonas haloaromaticamans TaxID=653954 RepID=A0A1S1HEE5_9SPHN|nr:MULTISPECIES: SRPBCC domain-containing protein [Sphingomonas]AGH48059.1 hypothetical protein G432_01655 [Sphingomonas sp. MM-1]MDX3884378.1 SRPBCC domain-containing protein [Sphingomonas sp.]OHT20458.1 Polyketide cyclase / dehydrase and lipid transport [Sphingomonas haloaromaticamans]
MALTDGMDLDPANVVRSERVEIDAPAAIVWEILTDFANYKAWNPFCIDCDSRLEIGAAVNMKLASYTVPGQVVDNVEYICAIEPERLISWELPFMEIWPYPARRDQIIEPLGPDRCAYNSTDAFFGDNGIHVMRFCGDWVKRAFDDTARALKARAEAIHSERKAA